MLQILLALWNLIGGAYTFSHYEEIRGAWMSGFLPAACLALNSLLGCALFTQYAGFPGMLWSVVPALLAAFVAYGRRARKPA